jgi:hypothetical protein
LKDATLAIHCCTVIHAERGGGFRRLKRDGAVFLLMVKSRETVGLALEADGDDVVFSQIWLCGFLCQINFFYLIILLTADFLIIFDVCLP